MQLKIAGQPDPTQATFGVHPRQRVTGVFRLAQGDERFNQDVANGRRQANERLAELGMINGDDGIAGGLIRDRGQRGAGCRRVS